MTNADKYKIAEEQADRMSDEFAEWHQDNPDVRGYGEALFRFLQAKVKPTLTEDEKVILRKLPKKYMYIGRRDGTPSIELYIKSDDDFKHCWCFYNDLFQFIKPRRRI